MNKIGNIVLWVSFAVTLVVAGMFFFGGTYEATTSTGGSCGAGWKDGLHRQDRTICHCSGTGLHTIA